MITEERTVCIYFELGHSKQIAGANSFLSDAKECKGAQRWAGYLKVQLNYIFQPLLPNVTRIYMLIILNVLTVILQMEFFQENYYTCQRGHIKNTDVLQFPGIRKCCETTYLESGFHLLYSPDPLWLIKLVKAMSLFKYEYTTGLPNFYNNCWFTLLWQALNFCYEYYKNCGISSL